MGGQQRLSVHGRLVRKVVAGEWDLSRRSREGRTISNPVDRVPGGSQPYRSAGQRVYDSVVIRLQPQMSIPLVVGLVAKNRALNTFDRIPLSVFKSRPVGRTSKVTIPHGTLDPRTAPNSLNPPVVKPRCLASVETFFTFSRGAGFAGFGPLAGERPLGVYL
jgi:hypothetical protein